jgi:hypothetical protein
MTPDEALAFVREHGVVLVSAKGPVPRLTEAIVGEPIKGSWWAHPKGRAIFSVLQELEDAPDLLTCRAVGGKVSLVHRRLWPALIRAAARFPRENLAKTTQEHSAAGHHVRRDTPFPDWADKESLAAAGALSEDEALAALGNWARQIPAPR